MVAKTDTKNDEVQGNLLNTEDDGDLLADEMDIHSMTDEERAKMKKELGIDGMIVDITTSSNTANTDADIENVDDLLADVNTDDIVEMSDAELAAELEKI